LVSKKQNNFKKIIYKKSGINHTQQEFQCSMQVSPDEKQTGCEQSHAAVLSFFDKISDNPESNHEEFHGK
jgi:hypothetical protein